MRILIVMPSATPHGGAEEALVQLIEHRKVAELHINVIFLENGPLVELFRLSGVNVDVCEVGRLRQIRRGTLAVLVLRKLIRRLQPAVVIAWMTKAHIYSGLAVLGTKVPSVYFQMGLPDGGLTDVISRCVPAKGALACSEFVARSQQREVTHSVRSVALGVNTKRFSAVESMLTSEIRRQLGLPIDQPLIGIVGRLQNWKGMHVYLDAMHMVLIRHPDCQGVIVGGPFDAEPKYPRRLAEQIEVLGLQPKVRMVGAQVNVPEWMQAMDIVVHASDREPFGIVVAEAMSLGKPVIATVPGGPEEIITDGVDGLLVPYGDAGALSHAICRYLDNPQLSLRCGIKAQERSELYSAAAYADRVGAALRNLVSS